jgi:recombinational DNA repair ATPase RecF
MIRIKTIHIEEFRGIRRLDLDLDKKNFGICGPNGTGKSGVVDALEFCLTGDVTRLSGQGTASLSVKTCAPHVDQRDHPERANVTVTAEIPSLGKAVKIHRSVKNHRKVNILPEDEDIKHVIDELQTHPEFALSRREIVKYIITPPGQRSKDVQTLLRLEHLEKLRSNLTTFNNGRKAEAAEADRNRRQAETELRNSLKIDNLDRALVLEKVNEKRKILGLQALAELRTDTSFKAGILAPKDAENRPAVRKGVALADLSALRSAISGPEPESLTENRQTAKIALEKLREDEQALQLMRRLGFIKTGLDLITENACPLCDKEWDADELRAYLRNKLLSAEEIDHLLSKLRGNINTLLQSMLERTKSIERVIEYGQSFKPPLEKAALEAHLKQIKEAETVLNNFLRDPCLIEPAVDAVALSWWSATAEQRTHIDECYAAVNDLPDTSIEDEASETLIVAQDRYERLLRVTKKEKELKSRSALSDKILDCYNNTCKAVLEGIYDEVAKDFSRFYCVINREDEEEFVGKLTSGPAKLSFDVDFYGRGLFPPGAYHSEGHQDGMGLCLYLALMKHTLGNKFTFAVLDDVLMSVDTGHRREVCRLLKSEFPDTQFILTTHDRVWLQYMKTERLIFGSQSFGGWTVDTGPLVWDDHDIWTEIQTELDKDDVAKAAGLLRHYLEYTSTILANNLRARVEFRGDGHYDLGDLMPHVLKEWRKMLEDGEKSADYWKRGAEKAALAAKRVKAKDLIARTNAEQWAINPSVHFNDWANLHRDEFRQVVYAFKELLENLRCENESCKSIFMFCRTREKRRNCAATAAPPILTSRRVPRTVMRGLKGATTKHCTQSSLPGGSTRSLGGESNGNAVHLKAAASMIVQCCFSEQHESSMRFYMTRSYPGHPSSKDSIFAAIVLTALMGSSTSFKVLK